jgi:BlaI family penicillinase repressor
MKNSLTPAEWIVMHALWEQSPLTLSEVIRQIGERANWSYRTYASYLTILCKKGAVTTESRYRDKLYAPAVTREECLQAESKSIVSKVQNSAVKDLVLYMVQEGSLDEQDRQELVSMLRHLHKED